MVLDCGFECLLWRPLLIQLRGNVFVGVLDSPIIGIVYQSCESFDGLQLQGVHCSIEKFHHVFFHIITAKAPF